MLVKPRVFEPFSGLAAAQSTRHGGVSAAPYHSLNLGKSTDDNPQHVAENRLRFCAALGFRPEQMAWSYQVHGVAVREAEAPGGAEGFDALISQTPGVLLGVSVADCAPILVYDRANGAVAAIHAGWKGSAGRIVTRALERMHERYGTRGQDCFAYVGACIDVCSFEVGEEVAEQFAPDLKQWNSERGKFFVDLKKANALQLLAFGVPENQLEISPFCTFVANDMFFSHRKDGGITGRGMAVIGMHAK